MKGGGEFLCPGRTVGRTIVEIFLRVGWTISVVKESYLKFEASGEQYCSIKLTDHSEMTITFVIFPALFDI